MPTKEQLESHTWHMANLQDAQKADHDQREQARECDDFLNQREGQWEDFWWTRNDDKPRYTFDQTSPIVDQVAGTIERSDFSVNVDPAGGMASQEIAKTYMGMIRNIENISDAKHTYNYTGRRIIETGLHGWQVDTDYVSADSFDQDLIIRRVHGWLNQVWFGPHKEQDASDCEYAWLLTGVTQEEFKEKYPGKSAQSVTTDQTMHAYYFREELVMVGEAFYLEPEERELVLFSNGAVYPADQADQVREELIRFGIQEIRRRTAVVNKVKRRKFSEAEWLEDPKDTVFENWIPLIPVYGNFKISDDKRIYRGIIERLMDPQRVYNYAQSRQIEEGAFAPRQKWLSTEKQREGHEEEWEEMNVSATPWLTYNHDDDGAPPPVYAGGAQINAGLKSLTDDMSGVMSMTAGMFAANMGEAASGNQSGEAIKELQDRGDTGSNKFLEALTIAQTQTARILINAIPRVYLPERQVRIIGEDGTKEMITIGQKAVDENGMPILDNNGRQVVLNDLNQGAYDVTFAAGPGFKTQQGESVNALRELGQSDPSIVELGGDILAKNINSPGMTEVAERKRMQLFMAGAIPESQYTDEERAMAEQAQNQPQEPDPMMVAAEAELEKARADQAQVNLDAMKARQQHQIDMGDQALKNRELDIKSAEVQIEAAQVGVKVQLTGAQAAKAMAEAEAQEVETTAVEAGITRLAEASGG